MSRKIILGLAFLFLITWGLNPLVLRGTIGYALSDNEAIILDNTAELQPNVDCFAQISGTPDHTAVVVTGATACPATGILRSTATASDQGRRTHTAFH